MGGRIMKQERAIIERGLKDPSSYNLFRGHRMGDRFGGVTIIFGGKSKPRPGYMELCEMFFSVMDLYLKLIRKRLGKTVPVHFRISNPFDRISDLFYAGKQCHILADLELTNGTEELLFFEDALNRAACLQLETILPSKCLCPPLLAEIRRYDAGHGTQFLNTLKTYLACSGDLAETARILHLHRNTADNRIKKTEELFGVDLKNAKTRMKLYMALDAGL